MLETGGENILANKPKTIKKLKENSLKDPLEVQKEADQAVSSILGSCLRKYNF